mgnify:CR=1 FL=1
MRMIIFFDLPVTNEFEKRTYRQFHQFLVKNGFLMLQNSVYSRIFLNGSSLNTAKENVYKHVPKSGSVCMLNITEKQFADMEFLIGKKKSDVIDSDKRVIELWKLPILF